MTARTHPDLAGNGRMAIEALLETRLGGNIEHGNRAVESKAGLLHSTDDQKTRHRCRSIVMLRGVFCKRPSEPC